MKKYYIVLLLLTLFATSTFAQSDGIKGIVKDKQTQEPLIGAIVVEELAGAQNGTTTDENGAFTLSIKGNSTTLNIHYMGYKSVSVAVKKGQQINIELSEDSQVLTELVVVGFGVQKKESVVGAISSVKGDNLISVPASNLTQSLAGKATGITVVQPSGEIGRDEAQIYIRGTATFNDESSKPLIVVDGIIRESFAQIDPNEIENFSILKDASATAVYGVKGANGVIIVTTKRGIAGKPQVSLTTQLAANVPMRLHEALDSYRSAMLKNEMGYSRNEAAEYKTDALMRYRTKVSPYTHPDVNWVDEIMRSYSTQQQYNINVRGGANTARYFVSGGFFNQNSPFNGDDITQFSRYNFRSNLDFDITKDFVVSINLGARIEDRKYPTSMQYSSWNVYHDAFATSGRNNPVYNMDGSYAGTKDAKNVVAAIKESGEFKENKNIFEVGINTEYKLNWLLPGLAVRGQIAYDDYSSHGKIYNKNIALYSYNYANDGYEQHGENRPLTWGWEYVNNYKKLYYEGGVSYTKDFNKHNVHALALFNRHTHGYNTDSEYATEGLVGRIVYGYDLKYMAEFNIGYNGTENFAKKNRYGTFPAFSAGWVVSQEPFYKKMKFSKIMDKFKIRSSIGWVGNDRAWVYSKKTNTVDEQRFLYLQQYNYVSPDKSYIFGAGDNIVQGIRQGDIANMDVEWETARKINIGLETGFFNGLFSLNVDYFHEKRTNSLLSPEEMLPEYVGTTFAPANIGEMTNQGVELEATFNKYINKNISYFIKGNFSFARNKIIKDDSSAGTLPYQSTVGYSRGTPLKFITIGYFQDYEDIENSPSQLGISGNTEVRPGDLKYKDINEDGIIDRYDMIRTGYPEIPEIQYGITLGGSYKGFDISVLFQGSANSSFDKNWEIMWAFSNGENVYEKHWSYWTPEIGDSRALYTQMYGKYQNNEAGGDYTLSSGNYLRVKNVDVGYTIPKHITQKVNISSVRVYVNALNLITWSKEPYLDPDNRNARGGNLPPVKTFNLGLNINF